MGEFGRHQSPLKPTRLFSSWEQNMKTVFWLSLVWAVSADQLIELDSTLEPFFKFEMFIDFIFYQFRSQTDWRKVCVFVCKGNGGQIGGGSNGSKCSWWLFWISLLFCQCCQ